MIMAAHSRYYRVVVLVVVVGRILLLACSRVTWSAMIRHPGPPGPGVQSAVPLAVSTSTSSRQFGSFDYLRRSCVYAAQRPLAGTGS